MGVVTGQGIITKLTQAQLWLSLVLLAALCLTSLVIGLLAHFSPVIPRHIAEEIERQRKNNALMEFTGGYADSGDYVLVGQVAQDDFSRGGVYFLGASNTAQSIMPWELPPAERKLIHNYALGDLSHRDARYFLRSLIEEHRLLQAGGDKTTVILCLFYGMTRPIPATGHFLALLFQRHGFYTYDSEMGIHRVPMSSLERFLRRERVYANRFLRVLTLSPSRVFPAAELDPKRFQAAWVDSMSGPDWKENMRAQMRELAVLIDYLREQKVRLRIVFAPIGSWNDGIPFDTTYRDMIEPILGSREVPVTDLSRFLPDEDFGDASHPRYSGQWKVHRVYRELALQALADMGTQVEP